MTPLASAMGAANATTGFFARRIASESAGSRAAMRRRVSTTRSVTSALMTRRTVSWRRREGGMSRLARRASASAAPITGRWRMSSVVNSPARNPSSRSWLW